MQQNNIPYDVALRRVIQFNWSVDRAIIEPVEKRTETEWKHYKRFAEKNFITYDTYYKRFKKGHPPEICILSYEDFSDYLKENG